MIDWMFMSVNWRILYYEDNTTFILRASEMQINKYVNMKPFSGPGFFISWGNPLFFYRFFKRTWRYHFLAERLSQSWTREETYHHICGKHRLEIWRACYQIVIVAIRLNEKNVELLTSISFVNEYFH